MSAAERWRAETDRLTALRDAHYKEMEAHLERRPRFVDILPDGSKRSVARVSDDVGLEVTGWLAANLIPAFQAWVAATFEERA